jgi:2-hydroxy-3-oxopropionate reductase
VGGWGAAGAPGAATPAAAAAGADVIVTMLPDSGAVEQVFSAVLEGAAPGALIVDMSTISPAVARELAARARAHGVGMLDAPVSGGEVGAQEGTLSIMVGGEAGDVERARPVLSALGTTITHVGPVGAGQVVKACNQVLVALVIQAAAEALVLASKAGVDPVLALEALSGGLGANRVLDVRGRGMVERDFRPGARAELHCKDLDIALDMAREVGAVLPGTALAGQLMRSVPPGRDHTALLTVIERLSA